MNIDINTIFLELVKLIIGFINLILIPIDNLILTFMPDISNIFTTIGQLFAYMSTGLGWVISFLGIPAGVISLIISYYTFKLTVPFLVYTIKLAIKWYNKLKV